MYPAAIGLLTGRKARKSTASKLRTGGRSAPVYIGIGSLLSNHVQRVSFVTTPILHLRSLASYRMFDISNLFVACCVYHEIVFVFLD
jgi:hypothetical protein